jgi:hypothetical protein
MRCIAWLRLRRRRGRLPRASGVACRILYDVKLAAQRDDCLAGTSAGTPFRAEHTLAFLLRSKAGS